MAPKESGLQLAIRLPPGLAADINRRAIGDDKDDRESFARSSAVRAHLARYYEMCARGIKALGLDRRELGWICDALNGTWLASDPMVDANGASRVTTIWFELGDNKQLNNGHRRWDLTDDEADALVRRLQAASYADVCAVVDFVERFWADDPAATKVIYPEG